MLINDYTTTVFNTFGAIAQKYNKYNNVIDFAIAINKPYLATAISSLHH